MSQFDKSELVSLAKLPFQNGHFNDVIIYMKEVINMGTPLKFNESLFILSRYYRLKNPFLDTLNSCKCSNLEEKYVNIYYYSETSNLNEKLLRELQIKAKTAINRISDEAIELLDSYWVKRDDSYEAIAHYKCIKAFQHNQKAYVASGEDKENEISKALELYEEATKIANENLNPAHPVRLNFAVNFSMFHIDLLDSVENALAVLKEAYEKGQNCLDELSDEDLKCYAEKCLGIMSEDIGDWS